MTLLKKMNKTAAPGQAAPGGDAEFEQTLAQLASMDIRDKAQTLIDYQIGFQLLDRDKKDNTADGVAVFRINNEWLLVPAIYRKGSIKGTNTLYMMEKDKIVPCTEAMVQKIINAPGKSMGRSVLRNQAKDNLTPAPDFSALVEPRANKIGSNGMLKVARLSQDLQKKARSFMEAYKQEPKKVEIRIKQAILDMGKDAVSILGGVFRQVPELLADFDKRHGMDVLRKAATIKTRVDQPHKPQSVLPKTASGHKGGVYIRSFFKGTVLPVSADPFEYISPRGVMFKDSREDEDTGKVFEQSIQQSGVQTPTMTGIYDVIGTGGEMFKALVIIGPEGETGRGKFSTVVRLKNPNFVNASKQAIMAVPIADGLAGVSVLDLLEDVTVTADENYDGDYYVVVSPKGIGTCPFRATVDASSPEEKAGTVFRVSMSDYNDYGGNPGWHENPRPGVVSEYDYSQRIEYIRFSDVESGSITRVGKELVIPKGSKVVRAYKSHKRPENENRNYPSYYSRENDPDSHPIRLGTFLDVDLALNSSAPNFKIASVPGGYSMEGKHFVPADAVKHLVLQHGLRPKTADELLDMTDKRAVLRKPFEFRMKSANPNWPTDPGYAVNNAYGDMPQLLSQEEVSNSYPSVADGQTGNMRQQEPDPMSSIQNAMATGHDDVIDAGMLGVLLESSKNKSIVDQYRQDLSKAVDRLGRISIHMARVPDVYEERYGRSDSMMIEEETNNCFDRLGKLVLQFSDNQIGGDDNDQTVSDLTQL